MGLRLGSRFRGPRPPEAVGRVKTRAREAPALGPEATLTVSEIACTDPSCPGIETVILLMRPGERTRAFKVAKPLEAGTEPELRAALV